MSLSQSWAIGNTPSLLQGLPAYNNGPVFHTYEQSPSLPWFLSITGVKSPSLGKASVFLIAKAILGIVGDVKS